MKKILLGTLALIISLQATAFFQQPVGTNQQIIAKEAFAQKRNEIINKINALFSSATTRRGYVYSFETKSMPGELLAQAVTPQYEQIGTTDPKYQWQQLRYHFPSDSKYESQRSAAVFNEIWGKIKELQSYQNFKISEQQIPAAETLGWILNPYNGKKYYLQLIR